MPLAWGSKCEIVADKICSNIGACQDSAGLGYTYPSVWPCPELSLLYLLDLLTPHILYPTPPQP